MDNTDSHKLLAEYIGDIIKLSTNRICGEIWTAVLVLSIITTIINTIIHIFVP